MAAVLDAETAVQIRLDPPLSSLPLVIGEWVGAEVEVSEGVQRIAKNDDFVSRVYRDSVTGDVVTLFIGYTARPRTMLGHRPQVCYPSAGWTHLSTRATSLGSTAGSTDLRTVKPLPILLHHFVRPGLPEQRRVVLSYYVLCGRPTIDESGFWSLRWRTPNLSRDAGRYLAQVQIAAPVPLSVEAAESAARRFAERAAGEILHLLPDPEP